MYKLLFLLLQVTIHGILSSAQQKSPNESFKRDVGDVRVVFPGDANYASASASYNLRFEVRPFAVTFPTNTEQVSIVVKAGARHNLRVVARSGGHSYIANGLGGKDGALVVDLSQMKGITVDPDSLNARIETGNRLGDIALALNEKERGLPHGRCSYVGIGGHSGFGGWGFASRMWGMTLDNILSATVVLANGTIAEVSEDSHAEIFWGIRGSSSSFAITTSILFKTHPIPPSGGTFFGYFWDIPTTVATQAFIAYQQWALTPNLTKTIGTDFAVLKGSAQGRVTLVLLGSYFSSTPGLSPNEVEGAFNETIAPFLSSSGLPEPDPSLGSALVTGSWIEVLGAGAVPTNVLNTTAGGEDAHDTFYAKSLMTPQEVPLTEEAMGAMMEYLGMVGWETDLFWHVEVELYGGADSAINAVPLDATAFAHRNTLFTFQPYASSSNLLPPFPDRAFGFVDGIVSSITSNMPANWDYGTYPNYIEDRLPDWQRRYYGPHYPRLEALKAVVDPMDVFQFPTSIEELVPDDY